METETILLPKGWKKSSVEEVGFKIGMQFLREYCKCCKLRPNCPLNRDINSAIENNRSYGHSVLRIVERESSGENERRMICTQYQEGEKENYFFPLERVGK